MDVLPKVLLNSLEMLCAEDILYNWNIGSHNNVTSVTIRFVKPGHIGSPPVTGMRKKSQSSLQRDSERQKSWKLTRNSSMYDPVSECQQNVSQIFNNVRGNLPGINTMNDDPHSENSSASDMGGSSHASLELTTTKTCDNDEGKSDHQISDPPQQSTSDTLTSDSPKDSAQAMGADPGQNYIDPARYFSKVVADFRSVVQFPTVRGLTWSGDIVNYEYDSRQKRLYVTQAYQGGQEYHWYMRDYNIVSTFVDQRYAPDWSKTMQDFVKAYEQYLNGNG